jgi:sugar/nucleoside kinase (ribokinase family)
MPPQFLVVGHIVQDLIPESASPAEHSPSERWRLGGAASYASIMARNLGLRTAVLTAASPELDVAALLPGIECHVVPSERTTQILNVYSNGRRRQTVPQRADRLRPEHLPYDWSRSDIVLLGPVAGEADDALATVFPDSLLAIGAQGWLREIGDDQRVRPLPPWQWDAPAVLRPAQALFLSNEDVTPEDAPGALAEWSRYVDVLAFTLGSEGANICYCGEWRHIEAFPAKEVDLTGAGDVFAAAFLVRYRESGDPWSSARFAAAAAAISIEAPGVEGIPTRAQVQKRMGSG